MGVFQGRTDMIEKVQPANGRQCRQPWLEMVYKINISPSTLERTSLSTEKSLLKRTVSDLLCYVLEIMLGGYVISLLNSQL